MELAIYVFYLEINILLHFRCAILPTCFFFDGDSHFNFISSFLFELNLDSNQSYHFGMTFLIKITFHQLNF